MPGRKYNSSVSPYRYGFNGKENDNEVKGEGNQQDYGMRIYDPRLVRFLSVDPLTKISIEESPYLFAGNSPIYMLDKVGGFKIPIHERIIKEVMKILGLSEHTYMALYTSQASADIGGGFYDNHFDNRLTAGDVYNRWNELHLGIHNAKLLKAGDGYPQKNVENQINLGFILHNVQDFYSHSNFVELYVEYYQKTHNGNIPQQDDIPIFDDALKNDAFKSGYLDKSLKTGRFNLWRWLIGTDKKTFNKRNIIHHDDLNKDDENTPEGKKLIGSRISLHKYARQTALKHTTKILQDKMKESGIKPVSHGDYPPWDPRSK